MSTLYIDIETFGHLDLSRVGVSRYARRAELLLLGWALDDGPVELWDSSVDPNGELLRLDVRPLFDSVDTVVAHNVSFERTMLRALLGWNRPLTGWDCTMSRALAHGLPGGLDRLGTILLPGDQRKLAEGKPLVKTFTQVYRGKRTRPGDAPEKWQQFREYCARDVEAMRALHRVLPRSNWRGAELATWRLDHEINERGLPIDGKLAMLAEQVALDEQVRLTDECVELTGLRPSQVAKLREWLAEHGVELPDLSRETVETTLALERRGMPDEVARVLTIRLESSRATAAKYTALLEGADPDDRLRWTLQYCGADRTMRWSGRRFQPQNLIRPVVDCVEAAEVLLAARGDRGAVEMVYHPTPVLDVVASAVRGVIKPRPGRVIVRGDFSQIEARITAWEAGQRDVLDLFARGEDVYVYQAERVGSSNRQLGKVLVLACGFGMGPVVFRLTAASYGLQLGEEEAERYVYGWREANDRVVSLWYAWDHRYRVEVPRNPKVWTVRLPSGHRLHYWQPRVSRDPDDGRTNLRYVTSRGRAYAWGGKLVENRVQSIARQLMAGAMRRLDRRDVKLVGTVHDEILAECDESDAARVAETMREEMARVPPWAKGLPVAAEVHVLPRYTKV